MEEEFRVVGALQQVFGNRSEWGVEALNQNSGIWGVGFLPNADNAQPKALVECGACKIAMQSTLSSIEYDVLLATGLISRHCDRCNETTRWMPSTQTVTAEILIRSKRKRESSAREERRTRRLKLTMQLRVRNAWGTVDIAQTRDVSNLGLCFMRIISPPWKHRVRSSGREKGLLAGFTESNTFDNLGALRRGENSCYPCLPIGSAGG